MRKTLLLTAAAVLLSCLCAAPAQARSWNDLHEQERELFGSEKFEKYPVNAFVIEHEEWEGHNAWTIFWFFKHIDYPRYRSTRILPLWYSLESKIDNRSLSCFLFFYGEVDGPDRLRINPLFIDSVHTRTGKDDGYSRTIASVFHYYHSERKAGSAVSDTTWWAPIVPLVYRSTNESGGHQNILWLLDYSWETADGRASLNRFWFAPFLFHSPGNDGYTLILPPFIVSNRYASGDLWLHALPVFAYSKSIGAYASGENRYEQTTISLFYGKQIEAKKSWDGERTFYRLWFPIIPIAYWYSDYGHGYHRNIAWIFDWHNDAKMKTDRFWAAPFWFWKKNAYTHILPPLYMKFKDSGVKTTLILPPLIISRDHTNGESWLHILPLFFYSQSIDWEGNEPRYETASASILHGYQSIEKNRWDGEPTLYRFWAPIIPIVYWYSDYGHEYHRNIAWLFDWHNDADMRTDRFWAAPAVFWKKDSYCHILPPVFMHFEDQQSQTTLILPPFIVRRDNADGESWLHAAPFFFHSRSINNEDGETAYETRSASALYGYQSLRKDSWNGEQTLSRLWFPIIPVYYSYDRKGIESHTNMLWLFDWHRKADSGIDRFWAAPLVFWKKNSYVHILPPIYMSFEDQDYRYAHIFPLGLQIQNGGKRTKEDSVYSLIGGYHSVRAQSDGDMQRRSLWFPLVPLLYHSFDKEEGTHTNMLAVIDWRSGADGVLKKFTFFPIINHESREGGMRYYFPYIRPAGWTGTNGYSISPLHYHRWSESEEILWSALIHYRRDNNETDEHINLWAPLWFAKETKDYAISSKFLLYFHYDNPQEKYFARITAPFYFNIDTPHRETTLFLPLYFDTKRRDGSGNFHVNIAGISTSLLAGTNPLASFGGGRNERGIYFDTDVSWLINMVSVGTRTTLPLSKTQFASSLPESMKEEQAAKKKSALSTRSSLTREDSINFFEFQFLYGLIAYKQADSKHHLRILPLSWYTWDENATYKRRNILPLYYSYMNKEDDEEYLLCLPLYGYQRQGKSFKEGYGLIAYWNEYNDADKRTERNILFPLFKWYESPTTFGWHALPILTWYAFHSENGSEYRRIFTMPFYYHSSRTNSSDRTTASSIWLTPLSYYSCTYESGTESTGWNPTIPVFGSREHMTKTKTALPAVRNQTASFAERTEGSSRSWLFPVWYSHDTFASDSEKKTSRNESFYFLLPLFGGYSSTSTADSKKEGAEYFAFFPAFIPLYISVSDGDSYTKEYGLIAYWKTYDALTKATEKSILWPIFNSYETPNSSGWRILPVVWHKYRNENSIGYRTTIIAPLLSIRTGETDANGKTLSSFMLNPLFYYSFENYGSTANENWTTTIPVAGIRSSETVETAAAKTKTTGAESAVTAKRSASSKWLIPLFYTSEESSEDSRSGNAVREITQLGLPLFYRHIICLSTAAHPEEKTTDSTLFVLGFYRQASSGGPSSSSFLGGLYANTVSASAWSHSLLWSMGKVSSDDKDFTFYIHPLWYYNNDSHLKKFYLLFGLLHMMRDNANRNADTSAFWWAFNTSIHNDKIYDHGKYRPAADRTTWAFPLFCYSSTQTTDAETPSWSTTFWAPIIPLVYYHNENDYRHLNIAVLFDMDRTENEGSRFWAIPFFFLNTSSEGYCHFLPLWIYSRDRGEKTASSASLMHYYERENTGTKNEETTFWAPIIPLSYWHSSADSTHFNLLGLIDIENNRREKNWNGWIAPLFFGKSGDDGYFHILPPLVLTSWSEAEKDSWQFILGMYHHTSPGFTRWNYLGLWDWQEKPSQHYSDWSLLFSSLEVEHSFDLTSIRAAWGLLADAEFSTKSSDYSLNGILYLAGVSRQGDSFRSRLLPLWYYEHERESYTLVVPPALTYIDSEEDGSCHQIVGLGAIWTRWYSPTEHSDLQLALLGIPYYRTQKEEKGYESSGVLWGLIFDHEKETETGYESFSFFKFVYKQVELEGKTYRSVFGIRI